MLQLGRQIQPASIENRARNKPPEYLKLKLEPLPQSI
jgi:hypothetical protein